MKTKWKKYLALSMVTVTAVSAILAGCGKKSGSADDELTFSVVPSGPVDTTVCPYDDWNENPAIKYWLGMEWDADGDGKGSNINLKFETPPTSADSDYYSTLLATGEYTDIMATGLLPSTVGSLYDEGIVQDLTEYVDKYMPNYSRFMEENPQLVPQMVNQVDGEDKILQIYAVNQDAPEPWESYMYRRDWIVKYGKNPETGAAFTGGWQDDAKTEWTDDVVFPSGETDPVYISDWEWMFDIFKEALKGEGITDGYAFQQMYTGFMSMGDLVTGFGGNTMGWYITKDGDVRYGATDDNENIRAYVECMKSWYDKGYMDSAFDENASDSVFFMIDQANTYSGKVGMWLGLTTQFGNAMDTGTGDATEGICYAAASQPINDKYGSAEAQGKDPWVYFAAGIRLGGSVIITDKASEKDIATLLTAIDYLYTQEGAELTTFGLSEDQQSEVKDEMMTKEGLDGTYTTKKNDAGETVYVWNPKIVEDSSQIAWNFNRMSLGMTINKNTEQGRSAFVQEQYDKIVKYPGGGDIKYLESRLTSDQQTNKSTVNTNAGTYFSTAIPDFITGRKALNDANWQEFVDTLKGYGVDDVTAQLKEVQ